MGDTTAKTTITTKMANCCAKDCRYALSNIKISPRRDGTWQTATNGRIIAVVRGDGECSEPTLLPSSILDAPGRKGIEVSLDGNGRWETSEGKFGEAGEGRYPDATYQLNNLSPTASVLSIDAKLLYQLAEAIGSNQVHLLLPDGNEGAIGVMPMSEDCQGIGVIVPLVLPEKDRKASIAEFDCRRSQYSLDSHHPTPAALLRSGLI